SSVPNFGADASPPPELGTLEDGAEISLTALEYDASLEDLGLAPAIIPAGTCRSLPVPDRVESAELKSSIAPVWATLEALPPSLVSFRIDCLRCPKGQHDGGGGACVPEDRCAEPAFH